MALFVAGAGRAPAAITVTTVHSFVRSDGNEPVGALVDGGDGHLYGATQVGGTGVTNPAGTVYRMTTAGALTTLYTFDFQVTGDEPFAGVLRLANGTLFGTTRGSGSFNGSVFRLGSTGDFTNLHAFAGYFGGADGGHPEATLVEGGDGNLYGTTSDGGASNVGTIYRIDAAGDYTIVHSFSGAAGPKDGATPRAALVRGSGGALYGTTSAGGPTPPFPASGTVFRFTPGVAGVETLHTFGGSDGSSPDTTLVRAGGGFLYGTTSSGGAHAGGTVFRIRETGEFESLHSFDLGSGEGYGPVGLAAGSDGNFYGTTTSGGASGIGTVYRIQPSGAFETLYSFSSLNGGGYGPRGPLVQAGDGNFYGTTYFGGAPSAQCGGGCGTVFRIPGSDVLVPEPDATLAGAAAAAALGLCSSRRRRARTQRTAGDGDQIRSCSSSTISGSPSRSR